MAVRSSRFGLLVSDELLWTGFEFTCVRSSSFCPPATPLPCVPVAKRFNLGFKPLKCCLLLFICSRTEPRHRPPVTLGADVCWPSCLTTVTRPTTEPKHFADVPRRNLFWRPFLPCVFVKTRLWNITWWTWRLADFCCLLAVFPIWANCLGTWSAETDEEIGLRRSISCSSLKSAAPWGSAGSQILSSWPHQWWNVAHLHSQNSL